MYFRTKTIKGSPLVQLVESYRNAEGSPRQRVVASLGAADLPVAEQASIAGAVTRALRGAGSGAGADWFEPALSTEATTSSRAHRRAGRALEGRPAGRRRHRARWGPPG